MRCQRGYVTDKEVSGSGEILTKESSVKNIGSWPIQYIGVTKQDVLGL